MIAELLPQISYSNKGYPYLGTQRDERLVETLLRRDLPPSTIIAIFQAYGFPLQNSDYRELQSMEATGDPTVGEAVAAEIKVREEATAAEKKAEEKRIEEEERCRKERARERRLAARRDTDPGCPYKTLKAAYADGWHDLRKEEYGGEKLRLKGHVLVRKTKKAVSATEWERRGYRVLPDQEPHCWLSGRVGGGAKSMTWAVYREDQVCPKRKVTD